MKLPEVVEQLEKHPDLHLYLDKILKKNKKTQATYLESLNHLSLIHISRKILVGSKCIEECDHQQLLPQQLRSLWFSRLHSHPSL